MTPLDAVLALAIICVALFGVFALWALSRTNERAMSHARDMMKANLALSEKPSAAHLANTMEDGDHEKPLQETNGRGYMRHMS